MGVFDNFAGRRGPSKNRAIVAPTLGRLCPLLGTACATEVRNDVKRVDVARRGPGVPRP